MRKIISLLAILFILVAHVEAQRNSGNISKVTLEEFSENLMHYFENKNDSIIYEAISIYQNRNYANMLDQVDNILLFFFYGIKNDNINKYNDFRNIVNRNNNLQRLINIFNTIENNDIGILLGQQEPSSDLNDIYWTLYFSSGNIQYINYLLTMIKNYYNETGNINYYLAARSAIWSMALNIITYSKVREIFNNNNIINNELKRYIQNTNPDRIQNDTVEFIRQQREKGIW
jgi:hypothetical protein